MTGWKSSWVFAFGLQGSQWVAFGWFGPGPSDRFSGFAWEASSLRLAHIRRACMVISMRTFLASAGLLTSRRNAMRALRGPS